jgi:hypothetical protein
MMHHDAISDFGDMLRHTGTHSGHNPGRLVPSDHPHFQGANGVMWCPVWVQVAAAHTGSLDLDDNLAVVRQRILDV